MIRIETKANKRKFVETALSEGLEAAKNSVPGEWFTVCHELDGTITIDKENLTQKEYEQWKKKNLFDNDTLLVVEIVPDVRETAEIKKLHSEGLSVDEISKRLKIRLEAVEMALTIQPEENKS